MEQDRGRRKTKVNANPRPRYEGARVLVTGAARGIGLAIARAYLSEGAHVVVVDSDMGALTAAFETESLTTCIAAGVGSSALFNQLSEEPEIDVLINNVGISSDMSFTDSSMDQVRNTFDTNVFGPWELTRSVVDRWLRAPGHIRNVVFISSLHAEKVRMVPDYSCTKAAIEMLVKELAVELGPHGIRVNAVEPGAIDTWSKAGRSDHDAHIRASSEQIPLRRLGQATEVARQVVHLSDNEVSAYVTGAILRVDGGLSHYNWLHTLYGSAAVERVKVEQLFEDAE